VRYSTVCTSVTHCLQYNTVKTMPSPSRVKRDVSSLMAAWPFPFHTSRYENRHGSRGNIGQSTLSAYTWFVVASLMHQKTIARSCQEISCTERQPSVTVESVCKMKKLFRAVSMVCVQVLSDLCSWTLLLWGSSHASVIPAGPCCLLTLPVPLHSDFLQGAAPTLVPLLLLPLLEGATLRQLDDPHHQEIVVTF